LKLKKEETAEGRRVGEICDGSYKKGDIVLLIDDLVTTAESKIEAIHSLEACGLKVRDVLVLIDREQGGKEELKKAGYELHAGFTLSQLVQHYRVSDRITPEKEKEVLDYLVNN
ncbi:MAG: phosphoribosyltransferase family protein, partial [Patescibacteria group bacterium]